MLPEDPGVAECCCFICARFVLACNFIVSLFWEHWKFASHGITLFFFFSFLSISRKCCRCCRSCCCPASLIHTSFHFRSSLSADFAGEGLTLVFPFSRPHSCGSLRHWVCPALHIYLWLCCDGRGYIYTYTWKTTNNGHPSGSFKNIHPSETVWWMVQHASYLAPWAFYSTAPFQERIQRSRHQP